MAAVGPSLDEHRDDRNAGAEREHRGSGWRVRGLPEERDEHAGAARVLVDQHGDDAVPRERVGHARDEVGRVAHQDLDARGGPEADDQRVEPEVVHAPDNDRDRVPDRGGPRGEELPVANVARDRDRAPSLRQRRVEGRLAFEPDVAGSGEDLLEQRELREGLAGVAERRLHERVPVGGVEVREGDAHVREGEATRRREQAMRRDPQAPADREPEIEREPPEEADAEAYRARERGVARPPRRAAEPPPGRAAPLLRGLDAQTTPARRTSWR